jgi:hypothetical protein
MSMPNLQGRAAWIFKEDDFDIDLIVGIKKHQDHRHPRAGDRHHDQLRPGFAASVKKATCWWAATTSATATRTTRPCAPCATWAWRA